MKINAMLLLIIFLGSSFVAVVATETKNTVEKFYINKSGSEWFEMLHEAKLQGKIIDLGCEENAPSRCAVAYVYYEN